MTMTIPTPPGRPLVVDDRMGGLAIGDGSVTLTAPLTAGAAPGSLAVTALPVAVASGNPIGVGGFDTTFASAPAAIGATSITVAGYVPSRDYASGAPVLAPGVGLVNCAWQMTDLKTLWEAGDVRGSDRPLPGGRVIPYPRLQTITKRSWPLTVSGYATPGGTLNSDPFVGFEENYDTMDRIVGPGPAADGTRLAVLVKPSGATRSASIHVNGILLGNQGGPVALGTLEVELPNGRFS